MWEVSELALRAVPSERLCHLAQPRVPAAGWQPDRPLLTAVSNTHTHTLFSWETADYVADYKPGLNSQNQLFSNLQVCFVFSFFTFRFGNKCI